jgi:rod shape-determining protein MreD
MDNPKRSRIEEILKREARILLLSVMLVLLQRVINPRILGTEVNVLMLFVIILVLIEPLYMVVRWAFYGGIAYDILSASWLGMHAVALLVAIVLVYVLLARVTNENWLLPIAAVLVGGSIYYTILALLLYVSVGSFGVTAYVIGVVLPAVLVVLVPALPVFLLVRWWRSVRRGEVPIDVY